MCMILIGCCNDSPNITHRCDLLVRNTLYYDKRKQGSKGRALRRALIQFGLQKGDRLEPSRHMPDVAMYDDFDFENPSNFPLRVIFWRRGNETLTRKRCPLFSADLFTSPSTTVALDMLHGFYLGVLAKWLGFALWEISLEDVFGFGRTFTEEEILQMSVREMWCFISSCYSRDRKDASKAPLTRINQLLYAAC